MYSKMHGLFLIFGKGFRLSSLFSVITTISPFSTSRINFAPIISNAQVSDASTYELSILPITKGRIP